MVILGHLVQVGLGDLDVIAEDRGVANLEGPDTGSRLFFFLQLDDPILAFQGSFLELIQFGVVFRLDEAAFLQGQGRLVGDGLFQ